MASFADNEMNVNITCLHVLYFGISEDSFSSLVCWPTNKRFWLPELLQSTCKIVIAIAEQCANDTQGCIVPFLILLFVCCLFIWGRGGPSTKGQFNHYCVWMGSRLGYFCQSISSTHSPV